MNVSAKVDVVIADGTPEPMPLEAAAGEYTETVDATPEGADHDHKPTQHRDGKEPWCKACGLTAANQEPTSRHRPADRAGSPKNPATP